MNKHKHIKIIILLLLFCFMLSCTKEQNQKVRIGILTHPKADNYKKALLQNFGNLAESTSEILVVESQKIQLGQNDQVDKLLARKIDVLLVDLLDKVAAGVIIGKTRAKKIPLIFYSNQPTSDDMKIWDKTVFVGVRPEDSWTIQAELVVDYWKSKQASDMNKDSILQWIVIGSDTMAENSRSAAKQHASVFDTEGIKHELQTILDIKPERSGSDLTDLKAILMQASSSFEAIVCMDDSIALRVVSVLQDMGYYKNDKHFPVIGLGGYSAAVESIGNNLLLGTVLHDTITEAKALYEIGNTLARGKPLSATRWIIENGKYVFIPFQKVTNDNYINYYNEVDSSN